MWLMSGQLKTTILHLVVLIFGLGLDIAEDGDLLFLGLLELLGLLDETEQLVGLLAEAGLDLAVDAVEQRALFAHLVDLRALAPDVRVRVVQSESQLFVLVLLALEGVAQREEVLALDSGDLLARVVEFLHFFLVDLLDALLAHVLELDLLDELFALLLQVGDLVVVLVVQVVRVLLLHALGHFQLQVPRPAACCCSASPGSGPCMTAAYLLSFIMRSAGSSNFSFCGAVSLRKFFADLYWFMK